MSRERKRLFDFQKERIETLALDARSRRGDEPFVILVLDLFDGFAKNIAIEKSSDLEVNSQIELTKSKGVLPCLVLDITEKEAGLLFEQTEAWESFKLLVNPDSVVRVAVVGDGGVSFATHGIPL